MTGRYTNTHNNTTNHHYIHTHKHTWQVSGEGKEIFSINWWQSHFSGWQHHILFMSLPPLKMSLPSYEMSLPSLHLNFPRTGGKVIFRGGKVILQDGKYLFYCMSPPHHKMPLPHSLHVLASKIMSLPHFARKKRVTLFFLSPQHPNCGKFIFRVAMSLIFDDIATFKNDLVIQ